MNIKNWLRRKLRCSHINLRQTFNGFHTCDDRHTRDGICGAYVRAAGVCPDCDQRISSKVLLPPNLRDLFHAHRGECMKDDPKVIANEAKNKHLNVWEPSERWQALLDRIALVPPADTRLDVEC